MTDNTTKTLSLPLKWIKVPAALLCDMALSAQELRIWVVLKGHCLKKDACDPGVRRLCDFTGLADRWVRRSLIELEKKGYLRRVPRRGTSSLYFPLPADGPRHCDTGHRGTPLPDQEGTPALQCQKPRHSSADKIDVLKQNKSTSPSASGSPKKRSPKKDPKKETDPRVKTLIDYFCTTYKAKLGYKYTVYGGKDGQHLKALLIDHSLETLKAGIDTFFNNQEDWLNGKRTIGVFFSQINQCLQQTATQQTQDLPPGCPGPGYSYDEHYKKWVKD
jgi:hypothetical protein